MKKQSRRSRRGFSLLEITLALVLLGIMLAVALPLLARYQRYAQLDMTARVLIANIYKARQLAVMQNARYRIYFDVMGHAYHYKVDYNNNRRLEATEQAARFFYLPLEIRFDCSGVKGPPSDPRKPPSSPVTFTHGLMSVGPEGRWSNPGTIYLGNAVEDRMAITVNIAGTVRLWEWDRDAGRWRHI
ncbi:MAG: prepilin-type N-terminal cleavage/methylation domain-containing protein [Acidobacteria bacterium]|nr:prepilin-type N-terminal cleavage/methylation domain-containing protein [Acidobacteriota bacterium]